MSGNNFRVPPTSWEAIQVETARLRNLLGLTAVPYFPIVDVLEKVLPRSIEGFHIRISDTKEMGPHEGLTHPDGKYIEIREDVYVAGCHGDARARFTMAHELGHLMKHTGLGTALARASPSDKVYMLSEPQANQYAAALLMPSWLASSQDTPQALVERFGVSWDAASNRIDMLRKRNWFGKRFGV